MFRIDQDGVRGKREIRQTLGLLLALGALGATPRPVWGAAEAPEIGSEVVVESPDTELKIGSQVVATAKVYRIYQVKHVAGDWVWIVSGAVRGWVTWDQIVGYREALEDLDKRINERSDPSGWSEFRRGLLRLAKEEWAAAVADFSMADEKRPDDPPTLNNRGLALTGLGDNARAISDFSAALAIDPKYTVAYVGRGLAWANLGSYQNAIADFSVVLADEPQNVSALLGRGLACVEAGQPDQAISDLTEALRLSPNPPRALTGRGLAWKARRQYAQAIDDLNEALMRNPDDADAQAGLATILSTCPDPRYRNPSRAFAAASRAYALHGRNCPDCFNTLAAVYAEAGDYAKAVAWQNKALKALPQESPERKPFADRLALYQTRKPYRESLEQPVDAIAATPETREAGAR